MRSAIGKWIAAFVVVEVQPEEFDAADFPQLLTRLEKHFTMPVSVITPDWEAEHGIRAKGTYCPAEALANPALAWRELTLPPCDDELPF